MALLCFMSMLVKLKSLNLENKVFTNEQYLMSQDNFLIQYIFDERYAIKLMN